MNTKLFVDDIRSAPDKSWDIARSFIEAINLLTLNNYEVVSLDHDLGDINNAEGRERTGYDVLMWMLDRKYTGSAYVPETVIVHTANPPARLKMQGIVDRYWYGR